MRTLYMTIVAALLVLALPVLASWADEMDTTPTRTETDSSGSTASRSQVREVAETALGVVCRVSSVGLDSAEEDLRGLLRQSDVFLTRGDIASKTLAVRVRRCALSAIMLELVRADARRREQQEGQGEPSMPGEEFEVSTLRRLWHSLRVDEHEWLEKSMFPDASLTKAMVREGISIGDVLSGDAARFTPPDREVWRLTFCNLMIGEADAQASSDTLFLDSLLLIQELRDLDPVVQVFLRDGGLPKSREALGESVGAILSPTRPGRVDTRSEQNWASIQLSLQRYWRIDSRRYEWMVVAQLASFVGDVNALPPYFRGAAKEGRMFRNMGQLVREPEHEEKQESPEE